MIQYPSFEMSKGKARLQFGRSGRDYYVYWGDVRKQWEKSYSHSKLLGLVGSQSAPAYNLPDVKALLGELSPEEVAVANKLRSFYGALAKMTSTTGELANLDVDVFETLLDLREIKSKIASPCRILDIGPGAGRHMAALFSSPEAKPAGYVGLEAIGMPYSLQNLAAGLLQVQGACSTFVDYIDFESDRLPFPELASLPERFIAHVPLWGASALPDAYFDLIICTYVLDEVAPQDFCSIRDIMARCLRPGGVVYCRGGQERAMLKDLYLYGFGTFHGQDITASLLGAGLAVKSCVVKASKLTRTFCRPSNAEAATGAGEYCRIANDTELMPRLQQDYIAQEIAALAADKRKVLVWTDPGRPLLTADLIEKLKNVNVVGVTTRMAVNEAITPEGLKELPVDKALGLAPDAVLILSNKMTSILRQLRENSGSGEFMLMRSFNYPVAFAYR
jgi:SAM-dependent methyltransferase